MGELVLSKILEWDSNFFGFKVAKILLDRLSLKALEGILEELRGKEILLVYWASNYEDKNSHKAAERLGGFLADEKVTYVVDLSDLILNKDVLKSEFIIEEYDKDIPDEDLFELSIQSGVYSRFNCDPKIGSENFRRMYREWIKNSVSKRIAQAVLVAKKSGKIVGMVTVGEKEGRGDIGLLSIVSESRGKGLGFSLVKSAQDWFKSQGYRRGQVITQKRNIFACKLYEKCGYRIEKIERFYHFWLDK